MSRKRRYELLSDLFGYLTDIGAYILPAVLFFYLYINSGSLYIEKLNLYIPRFRMHVIVLFMYILGVFFPKDPWFDSFPLNMTSHLCPLGIFCFLFLLQGNFKLGAVIFALSLLIPAGFILFIYRMNWKREEKIRVFRRMVMLFFLVLQIPVLCLVGFRYGIKNTHPAFGRRMIAAENDKLKDRFDRQGDKMLCFKEDNWRKLSADEKREALQALADVYCEYLCAEPVRVKFKDLGEETLGLYNPLQGTISVSSRLAEGPSYAAAETLCHEVRHAYQHAVVNMLDWNDDMVKNHYYYLDARLWKAEDEDYVSGEEDNFEEYYHQRKESDARYFEKQGTTYLSIYLGDQEGYAAYQALKEGQ